MKLKHLKLIKKIILGSLIASRAAASSIPVGGPVSHEENAWANVRREVEVTEQNMALASRSFPHGNDDSPTPFDVAEMHPHMRPPTTDWSDGDASWTALLAASGATTDAAALMNVRLRTANSSLLRGEPATREQYLDQWLTKASGCYDDGGNCGVGVGGGGGNGIGNEGGGVGPPITEPPGGGPPSGPPGGPPSGPPGGPPSGPPGGPPSGPPGGGPPGNR